MTLNQEQLLLSTTVINITITITKNTTRLILNATTTTTTNPNSRPYKKFSVAYSTFFIVSSMLMTISMQWNLWSMEKYQHPSTLVV